MHKLPVKRKEDYGFPCEKPGTKVGAKQSNKSNQPIAWLRFQHWPSAKLIKWMEGQTAKNIETEIKSKITVRETE